MYCAPEILNKKPYDHACDFWSIGVLMYILLTGFVPFYDDDDVELANDIKAGEYKTNVPEWQGLSDSSKHLL
jgi:calcium/calmodulin-dependent protein kinase I